MKQILSGTGKVRGRLIEIGNQIQITDSNGKLLGRYDKTQKRTFDRQGRNIGPGDQTMFLLED